MEAKSQHQEEKLRNMNSSLTSGFGYSDVSSAANSSSIPIHLMNQIQTIDSNPDQMFNLTTNMEMIGYFPPANNDHDQSSTGVTDQDHSNSWQENNHRLLVDDSSLRCVFAGGDDDQGNDLRTSQGLSLSLSSINPSTAGFESFDLRHNNSSTSPIAHHQIEDHQVMYLSSTSRYQGIQPAGHQMLTDGFLGKVSNLHIHQHGLHQFQLIRNSKYLKPAQELLNEFCSLGSKQSHHYHQQKKASKQKVHGSVNQWDHNEHAGTSSNTESSRNHNLYSLELLELQKRKAQLLSMLEEVDRRYKHYCDQMKAVVSSFEAAAGNGAATVYSALASKAMSRHFRCLRDGIIEQIQATKKAMGEKDDQVIVALGTTRGETPRLRLLDQTLRQQKAFQQLNMIESHPWRPQRGLPERSVSFLRAWLFEHFLHPYPTDVDKHILARQTGLSRSQVSNWFINARVRLWKPMVEEMYMEETKEDLAENTNPSSSNNNNLLISSSTFDRNNVGFMPPNNVHNMSHLAPMRHHHHHHQYYEDDQKPTLDQLIPIDSDCLSSIINHNNSSLNNPIGAYNHTSTNTGAVELDFSSYNPSQNFNRGGASSVSLTLGLQQHGGEGGGVSLAYHNNPSAGASSHGTLFYGPGRDSIDECQTMQYTSVMDGDQGHNLPYRNLMGAQLLHDLAG